MVVRKIPNGMHPRIRQRLKRAARDPLRAYSVVGLQVGDDHYRLSLFLQKGKGLVALQAVRSREGEPLVLLTDAQLLLALMELWIAKG